MVGPYLEAGLTDIGMRTTLPLDILCLAADTVGYGEGAGGIFNELAHVIMCADKVFFGDGDALFHRDRTELGDAAGTGHFGGGEPFLMVFMKGVDEFPGEAIDLEINDASGSNAGVFITLFSESILIYQHRTFEGHTVEGLLEIFKRYLNTAFKSTGINALCRFQFNIGKTGGYSGLFRCEQVPEETDINTGFSGRVADRSFVEVSL
jgi:hypothetical protein